MSGLRLGEIVLDPRGSIYLPSLKALVCCGLKQALACSNSHYVKDVTRKMDLVLGRYNPETVIVLGPLEDENGLSIIARKWGSKTRFIFVASNYSADARAVAEALHFEIHKELIWDKFRFIQFFDAPPFVDSKDMQTLDFQCLTIAGGANYFVRIGKAPYDPLHLFTGEKLRVFLRGLGRFNLPSLDPKQTLTSIFSMTDDPFFPRYDVFALGHSRILPLGKTTELKKFVSLDALPVSRKALGTRKAILKNSGGILPN